MIKELIRQGYTQAAEPTGFHSHQAGDAHHVQQNTCSSANYPS